MRVLGRHRWRVRRALQRRGIHVERLGDADRRFRTEPADDTGPVPPELVGELRDDHPDLVALRARYAAFGGPVTEHSRWGDEALRRRLDLRWFRGDNGFVWHYREGLRLTRLKFLLLTHDVLGQDVGDLARVLTEDGAFGCWTHEFTGLPPLSRDLLDSIGEIAFLDRHLGLRSRPVRILDVGAGYGRLAHRAVTAAPDATVRCTDAIPEATFLCDLYLRHRGVHPAASVVPLDEVGDLQPGSFDLAVNVHSWSECTRAAVDWWLSQLARLDVPLLFLVPNEAEGFTSLEPDGRRLDLLPSLAGAGFELVAEEPVVADPATRAELGLHDRRCLFRRETAR